MPLYACSAKSLLRVSNVSEVGAQGRGCERGVGRWASRGHWLEALQKGSFEQHFGYIGDGKVEGGGKML
jgi:hypothetical protein